MTQVQDKVARSAAGERARPVLWAAALCAALALMGSASAKTLVFCS